MSNIAKSCSRWEKSVEGRNTKVFLRQAHATARPMYVCEFIMAAHTMSPGLNNVMRTQCTMHVT